MSSRRVCISYPTTREHPCTITTNTLVLLPTILFEMEGCPFSLCCFTLLFSNPLAANDCGDGAEPWVAFILPSLMHTVVFRREADRRAAALKPFK